MTARPHPVAITIDDARRVSGLLQAPNNAHVCYVLAHGAGAGMSHPFMAAVADGLAGSVASPHCAISFPIWSRAPSTRTRRNLPKPLVAGGKSFGGRMTSQHRPNLHCPGSGASRSSDSRCMPSDAPSDERARHVLEVAIPMLFLQGTRKARLRRESHGL